MLDTGLVEVGLVIGCEEATEVGAVGATEVGAVGATEVEAVGFAGPTGVDGVGALSP